MLTADLVRARRRGDELQLSSLGPKQRRRALELAQAYLEIARAHRGLARGVFLEACNHVPVAPSERKLAAGLRKLVDDRCEFEVACEHDPRVLRRDVFRAASAAQRELDEDTPFDRDAFLREQAARYAMDPAALEQALYSDLRSEQRLQHFEDMSAEALVERYRSEQAKAVLLRAVRVTAWVRCADAYAYRAVFRKLKFLRLLHRIEPRDSGYRIDIDGPFSLFTSVTKYGLQLALALPVLQACDAWEIDADVRWGKERRPLRFRLRGKREAVPETAALPDEVAALLQRFDKLGTPWRAEPCDDILELPGVGLCVPDLRFVKSGTDEVAYLEVLGFWSREAVWRRVELVENGLPHRVIFAASKRLRVSEQVLDEQLPGELYVYKGVISAREILQRLDGNSSSRARRS